MIPSGRTVQYRQVRWLTTATTTAQIWRARLAAATPIGNSSESRATPCSDCTSFTSSSTTNPYAQVRQCTPMYGVVTVTGSLVSFPTSRLPTGNERLTLRFHSTLATSSSTTTVAATQLERDTVPIGIAHEESNLIPTVQEALIAGVWQSTTAKRDKILELKAELVAMQMRAKDAAADTVPLTLEDAATNRQKLDLWLVHGLSLVARATETRTSDGANAILTQLAQGIAHTLDVESSWAEYHDEASDLHSQHSQPPYDNDSLNQAQWESLLESIGKQLEQALANVPEPNRCLHAARDFLPLDDKETAKHTTGTTESQVTPTIEANTTPSDDATDLFFEDCVTRFRIQTALAVVAELKTSWSKWTTVTDQDVDRAAVQLSKPLSQEAIVMSRRKVCAVLVAFLGKPSTQRLDALWSLLDKDNDGLLDQIEMDHVCAVTVKVVQDALRQQLSEALGAAPLDQVMVENNTVPTMGWRQRQRDKSEKAKLVRMMQTALNRQFEDELEMPNRLRCVYAWANKSHQNNKINSVLVSSDAAGPGNGPTLTGRQRYVELHPKISLDEFREVQAIHFVQLDQVGSEFLAAFRDEILVHQGKQRQNRELQRDCAVFFAIVCVLDYVILSL